MENEDRLDRLDAMIREDRLVRGGWTDGRYRACLLVALAPECGESRSPRECPATVMPKWLAELTPWMDDAGSTEAWPGLVRRYAGLARRWHVLDAAAWRRLDYTSRAIAVREARSHVAPGDPALVAIDAVLALLEREHVDPAATTAAAWTAAAATARSARTPAARARARAVADADADAAAAAAAAAWAAAAAAWAASDAAWAAAGSAAAATARATWAAGAAGASAAADRITDAILDAIEREIAAAE